MSRGRSGAGVIEVPRLLNQEELAALLSVDQGTIANWRRRDVLPPAVRIGRCVRWPLSDVLAWIDDHREERA